MKPTQTSHFAGAAVLAACLTLFTACGKSQDAESDSASQLGSTRQALAFNPLPGSFTWKMDERFPKDTNGDGVREEVQTVAYVRPEKYWVTIDGCVPGSVATPDPVTGYVYPSGYSYFWTIEGQTFEGPCKLSRGFSGLGEFPVSLRITSYGQEATYRQKLTLKDYLIVSIGDSYGSGEGAPDVPADYAQGRGPKWANTRCHRSFNSPSAVSARQLEESDPHSSVTYLSFACSGATISRNTWEPNPTTGLPMHGFAGPGDGPFNGSGLLGEYVGIEHEGLTDMLRPQVDAVADLVGARPVDALVVSGGGNDVGFGDVLRWCTLYMQCMWGNDGESLRSRVDPLKNQLPQSYAALSGRFGARTLNLRTVQLMEYPEIARQANGDFCDKILQDTNIYTFGETTKQELFELDRYIYQPLLQAMKDAAAANRWVYVPGIGDDFAGRGRASSTGRGYCAHWSQRWINNAYDAAARQGPEGSEKDTQGKAHPNQAGYQVMADRLTDSLRATAPELSPDSTLLRNDDTGGIYVIQGGGKLPIPSWEWFVQLGYDAANVRHVPAHVLSAFPDSPRDGTLLHDPQTGKVYVIHGGAKLHVANPDQFAALGYDWAQVRTVAPAALAQLPDVPRDGSLVADRLTGRVYVMVGGAKLYISSPAQFDALGFYWNEVRQVPETALATYPEVPRDGTLLHNPEDGRVYVIHGGAKFWIQTTDQMVRLGYNWGQTRKAPGNAIAAIPDVPRDGTLYTTETSNGGVYVVAYGSRFGIPDAGYFARAGYDWAKVRPLPSTAVASLPWAPAGHVEDIRTDGWVGGWAFDADAPGQQIQVHLYIDGPAGVGRFVASTWTSMYRPDVNAAYAAFGLTGNHGFAVQVAPQYRDGLSHTVYAYALNNAGAFNPWLDANAFPIVWR